MLLLFLFFLPTINAIPWPWRITQYVEVTGTNTIGPSTTTDGDQTYTIGDELPSGALLEITVSPTGPVTAVSVFTSSWYQSGITVVNEILPTNAAAVPFPTSFSCRVPYQYDCNGIYSNFWAALTVENLLCTPTISYVTTINVLPPPDIWNYLSYTSAATSTYSYATGPNEPQITNPTQTTATAYTTWTEADMYLAQGQIVPTLQAQEQSLLNMCRDPRGCYSGVGDGCTATGTGALAGTATSKSSGRSLAPSACGNWKSVLLVTTVWMLGLAIGGGEIWL